MCGVTLVLFTFRVDGFKYKRYHRLCIEIENRQRNNQKINRNPEENIMQEAVLKLQKFGVPPEGFESVTFPGR